MGMVAAHACPPRCCGATMNGCDCQVGDGWGTLGWDYTKTLCTVCSLGHVIVTEIPRGELGAQLQWGWERLQSCVLQHEVGQCRLATSWSWLLSR